VLLLVFAQSMADLYLPTLMSDIVDVGIAKGDTAYILRVGGFMLLVAAGGAICTITASYLSSRTASGFGKTLRSKVFTKVESFSLNEFDQVGTASLITRSTNDITQIQQVLLVMMRMVIAAPIMCIGGVIMAVSKDTALSTLLVVVIPVLAGLIALVTHFSVPLFKSIQRKLDRLNLVLRENLTGVRVIRAFNRTGHEQERFTNANKDLTGTAIKVNRIMGTMMPLVNLLLNLTTVAVMWFGAKRIDSGHMQVGSLMAFMQYVMQIMFSLIMASMMFIMIPRASASAERINQVLDIEPVINDPAAGKAEAIRGSVEFRDVTFSYPGAEQPALSGISFSALPGKVTAIIGGTGSGKSTLISLIPRFYDVDNGSVRVDGVDVREMSQADVRAKIGYVPQKAVLFTGSVSDNIRYGKEDATDDEVRHAADIAQATGFITAMSDGFDAIISQGGTNVSGGQKQRLAMARALVRRPEIYVFDDSFSALDFKTDARLRAALKKETNDSTVIIVGQRVSTVMDADQIIVLEEGRIAGIGTHKELLKTCGVYREIVSSQLSEEELA
jgi:ATP-binding cassette subfamily B protein